MPRGFDRRDSSPQFSSAFSFNLKFNLKFNLTFNLKFKTQARHKLLALRKQLPLIQAMTIARHD